MPDSMYALILAGGSGERFWPLSRRARPKQLLSLVSNKTLLEETVARLEGLIPARTDSDSYEHRTGKRSSKITAGFSKGEHRGRAG
jgi:molybdopterin-guanine dinucleotide biosynthesis protein A